MDVIQKLIGDKVPSASVSKPKAKAREVKSVMIGGDDEIQSKKSKYENITKDEVISLIKSYIQEKEAESE